ncbi:putative bifunctional diguanylate cyclase/phosphodiesterase [Longimicrobium terrae]|uniref:Diguanylate cyclase (GGDEF)-like protein n=1 Tax=Longimicrobium terrae TaxID=1639882 RepID=A0A841GZP0_9BACT|nr:EAL domain-containing protein [Longimicrobium terrae]MBB4636805.1 diguanylate cyclase (GGDEF)-like protein [Longimicrobium terrae]MBB6071196.1 diguanylate cyclase (GGDEF)-like protein [Longimicrobium terrae]NNC29244.1 EAL domain-containing protein [Longimicrobium terrae]
MPDIAGYVIVGNLAQAVGALVLGLLLLGFHRRDEHAWTRHWAWSWLALMVYLAGSAAVITALRLPATHPLRLSLTLASLTGAYLQVVWLVAGSWEVHTGRTLPARRMRVLAGAAVAVALACTLAYVAPREAAAQRHFMRVGVRSLVLMCGLLASARLAWPSGGDERRAGRRMAATGFVLLAAQQAVYGGLSIAGLGRSEPASWTGVLGTVDFLLQWIIGLGMVMILLEQQRAGALRSAADAERLAFHDPLTGLPNRRLLRQRLRASLSGDGGVGVAFLDLDRFKVINDSLGHAAGDDLLRQAGSRLRLAVPDEATVSRLGGDEFVLVLPGVADGAECGAAVRRALDTLRAPFLIAGHELFVTASAGISVAPADGVDADALVRQADLAMYRAKAERIGGVAFFTPEMHRQARERLETETELRRALAEDQLVLVYQPVVDVGSGRVWGVEALLRWRHPRRGLLAPSEFLAVAEAAGLIVPIGAWALRTACARAAAWPATSGEGAPRVMVNLSARQFLEPDLPCTITGALADAGLAPGRLELEITESMAMEDVAATEAVLRALKDAGVRISIDDFGTGYSSFEYLRRFPIDTLKVDRGFVAQVEERGGDAEIVAAIVAMAHRLGLVVIGEGVETAGQLAFLREQGCDAVQGYLVARPMSGEEMDLFLARPLAGMGGG